MTPDAGPLTGPTARIRRHRVALAVAGLAMAGLLVIGWLALPGFWHRHVLQLGATDIHDPGLLDDRISVCGRHWNLDVTGREFTRAQLQATFGDNVDEALAHTKDLIVGYVESNREYGYPMPLTPSEIESLLIQLKG